MLFVPSPACRKTGVVVSKQPPFFNNKNSLCYSFFCPSQALPAFGYFLKPSIFLKTFKSTVMMTALFVLSLLVFIYLVYVLLKPEKF